MQVVRNKIYSVLTSDSAYIVLLGSPTAKPYKTYYLTPPATPSFPFVVFWLRPQTFMQRYPRELLVSRAVLTVNAWDHSTSAAPTHEAIMQRVMELLHQVPVVTGFRCIISNEPQELRDEEMNAFGLTSAFELSYRRSLI